MTNATNMTANITATGDASYISDIPTAVDAEIFWCGELIGHVTLVPDDSEGELSRWGTPDHWASPEMMTWLNTWGESKSDRILDLEVAVRAEISQ